MIDAVSGCSPGSAITSGANEPSIDSRSTTSPTSAIVTPTVSSMLAMARATLSPDHSKSMPISTSCTVILRADGRCISITFISDRAAGSPTRRLTGCFANRLLSERYCCSNWLIIDSSRSTSKWLTLLASLCVTATVAPVTSPYIIVSDEIYFPTYPTRISRLSASIDTFDTRSPS